MTGSSFRLRRVNPQYPLLAGILICAWQVFGFGVGTGYLFDDHSSVVPLLDLRDSPELFWDLVLNDRSGPLGRPLTLLTFAIEQSFIHAEPALSQRVSVGLHIVNGILIFAITKSLLMNARNATPVVAPLFVAAIWLLTPQKVSTVLYIVQRMSILASFFVLLAIFFFLKARFSHKPAVKACYGAGSLISVICAPFAKENGALALPLIAATEMFALSHLRDGKWDRHLKLAAFLVLVGYLVSFTGYGLVSYVAHNEAYSNRSFTLAERLLSAPSVLLDYARSFYVPDIGLMGFIYDDYPLGGPRHRPLVFAVAVLLFIASLGLLVVSAKRAVLRIPAYGLALFLIGHSIESSYIPLELYFEHRNYLPSVGLSLLLVPAIGFLYARSGRSRVLGVLLGVVYLTSITVSTAALSMQWSSPSTLLVHHLSGHPRSVRANADYAWMSAMAGELDVARSHLKLAAVLSREEPAAKKFGDADEVLHRVAAACLAGESFLEELAEGEYYDQWPQLSSNTLRLLRRIHEDEVCPQGDWMIVSDWLEEYVELRLSQNRPLSYAVLRDLVALERSIGNPIRVFLFARMALEENPDDGMLHLVSLQAAAEIGDRFEVVNELAALNRLSARGSLRPLEERLYEAVKKSIRVKSQSDE